MRLVPLPALLVAAALLVGCGPPDVFGDYEVDLTLMVENCPDIDEGDEANDLSADVSQNGRQVLATVVIIPVIWEVDFLGETNSRGFTADSTNVYTAMVGGGCVMTYDFSLDLEVDGQLVQGLMIQHGVSDGSAACTVDECEGTWAVLGLRTCGTDPCD